MLGSYKAYGPSAKAIDYIFINSFIDLFFLAIEFWVMIIRCGSLCPYGYSYASKWYETYIFLYCGYVLVTSQVFLHVYVAFDRLSMFSVAVRSTKNCQFNLYHVYAICLILSIVANVLLYAASLEVNAIGLYWSPPGNAKGGF